jgi:hypothetical protein
MFTINRFLVTIIFYILWTNGLSQKHKDSVTNFPTIRVSLAVQSPKGDFEEDFGLNSNIGISVGWKNGKNNF